MEKILRVRNVDQRLSTRFDTRHFALFNAAACVCTDTPRASAEAMFLARFDGVSFGINEYIGCR